MAWITTFSEPEAKGRLAEVYLNICERMGFVPNIMKSFSLKPELLDVVSRTFMRATFGGSNLTRVQEEMIATVVSAANRCHY